jgi:hypothetical protein
VSGHKKILSAAPGSIDLLFARMRCAVEDELAAPIGMIGAAFVKKSLSRVCGCRRGLLRRFGLDVDEVQRRLTTSTRKATAENGEFAEQHSRRSMRSPRFLLCRPSTPRQTYKKELFN